MFRHKRALVHFSYFASEVHTNTRLQRYRKEEEEEEDDELYNYYVDNPCLLIFIGCALICGA